MTYCRYHCRACSSHFTSLEAFDAHRRGDHAANTRECRDPAEITKGSHALVELEGTCRIDRGPDEPRVDVPVYALERSLRVEAAPQRRDHASRSRSTTTAERQGQTGVAA